MHGTDRRLRIERLEERQALAADFELLVDATTTPERGGSNPTQLTVVGDVAYFVATTPTTGAELWKTDGTAAGTVLVKDIRGGRVGSAPTKLTNVNGTLFFVANDSTHGAELWASDGTTAGTQMLSNIAGSSASEFFTDLIAVGDVAYFIHATLSGATELWKSDGTQAGTTLVRSMASATSFSLASRSLIESNGTLFFVGIHGSYGAELWKSDGTSVGTSMVRDIKVGNESGLPMTSSGAKFSAQLFNLDGVIYFAANGGSSLASNNFELWRSDGTAAGTTLVKEINTSIGIGSSPQHFTEYDGSLIFLADDGTNGLELWRSDGTAEGTTLVKNVASTSASGFPMNKALNGADSPFFTEHDGLLYFIAADNNVKELWRTDGTSQGTFKATGVLSAHFSFYDFSLTSINGLLYFIDAGGNAYASDATAAGTSLLAPFSYSTAYQFSSQPGSFVQVGDQILLVGNSSEHGNELWTTDGTPAGTQLFKDIVSGNAGSSPGLPVEFNGGIYFSAAGMLWESDGRTATPLDLKSPLGESLTSVNDVVVLGDAIYVTASTSVTGRELWRTDGTSAGTSLVHDTRPGATSGTFNYLKRVGDKLYFNDGNLQLWESDGTELGTKPIAVAQNDSSDHLAYFDGALYLPAEVDDSGQELWRVDANGAVKLKDFSADSRGGEPEDFVALNGLLYFTAHNGTWYRRDLWRTDGTPEGTSLAVNLNGSGRSNVYSLTRFRGELYFTMEDDQTGVSLWKSDGTAAGTTQIKVIKPTRTGVVTGAFIESNGILFFTANDGAYGTEVWRSDGTTEGTYLLADINPGPSPSLPTLLTDVYGTLYFVANDETRGEELWKSDGTPEGTVLVKDFVPGSGGSAIRWISGYRGGVIVAARTLEYGEEVWTQMPDSRGDYTGDGVTDGADFLAWQRGFGGSVTTPGDGADGNEDGDIDAADLAIWLHGFGTVAEESFESAGDDIVAALAVESWDDLALSELAAPDLSNVAASGMPIAIASDGALVDEAFFWLAAERVGVQEASQPPLAAWEEEASFALARAGAVARVGDPLGWNDGEDSPFDRATPIGNEAEIAEEAERALPTVDVGLASCFSLAAGSTIMGEPWNSH
jgi:ELWxxDGT repeat protein